jgi:hypothetical protein
MGGEHEGRCDLAGHASFIKEAPMSQSRTELIDLLTQAFFTGLAIVAVVTVSNGFQAML